MGDPRVASFDQSSTDLHGVFGGLGLHDPVTGLQRTRPAAMIGVWDDSSGLYQKASADVHGAYGAEGIHDPVTGLHRERPAAVESGRLREDGTDWTPEFHLNAVEGIDVDDFFETFEMGGE